MKRMTIKESTLKGLERLGWIERRTRGKRRVYVHDMHDYLLFVGPSGALRKSKRTISDSISLTGSRFHSAIQEVGRSNWQEPVSQEAAESLFLAVLNQVKVAER